MSQIGKLQLMAAVPGKQAAGQIVQLMNISGVRIFLQKVQKPSEKIRSQVISVLWKN